MTAYIAQTDQERELLAQWAVERIQGCEGFGEPYYCIGIWKRGKLAAVAVYAGFRGVMGRDLQCEISFASDDPLWCTKEAIRLILWYGLVNLNCRRMTAITHARNQRVHRLLEGIGFRKEGRHLDMFTDGDAISFGMTRRWFMKSRHYGQIQSLAA